MSRSHKINHRVIGNDYPYYYRKPKTTQERKIACDDEHRPYIRGKRTARSLPNAWDDRPKSQINPKSWKKITKNKHQSKVESRGKKHSIYLPENKNLTSSSSWRDMTYLKVSSFEDYCKRHSIPHNVVEKKKISFRYYDEKVFVPNGKMKHYYRLARCGTNETSVAPKIFYSVQDGDWVLTGKQKKHKIRETIGYTLTWWSDKDIGIDRILNNI